MHTYKPMIEVLRPGKVGEAEVRHYSPSASERMIACLHGCRDPGDSFAELRVRGGLVMSDTTDSTDRHIPGTRLRCEGKGRIGTRLKVWLGDKLLLDHNSAETHRCNQEVEDWLLRCIGGVRRKHLPLLGSAM